MTTGEPEPTIQRFGAAGAATAGPYSDGSCDTLENVAQTHGFITDEPWQAHEVWLTFPFVIVPVATFLFVHNLISFHEML